MRVHMSRMLCCFFYRSTTSPSQLLVRLGGLLASDPDPDAVYSGVTRMFSYPYYDTDAIIGDIALLQLSSPVAYTDTILPICLPSRDVDLNRFKVCVDTGFGRTNYSGLHTLTVNFSVCIMRTPFYRLKNMQHSWPRNAEYVSKPFLKKRADLYYCSLSVKYEPILINIGKYVLE